jgi:hypothetical protein
MTEKSKSMCGGCHDDFYNHSVSGGCWCFENAKVVTRMRVGVWQNPPYKWAPQEVLSCYNPDGARMIGKSDPRVVE